MGFENPAFTYVCNHVRARGSDARVYKISTICVGILFVLAPLFIVGGANVSPGPNPLMNRSISNLDLVKQVGIILSIREPPKDELNAIRNKVTQGTGVWLTERQDYTDWVGKSQKSPGSKVFYLIGPPATGKSSLAAVVIDHLQYLRKDCQYHFFTSSHQAKRTVAFCLRTIAFQLALINEEFREKLLQLHEETGVIFTAQDQNFDAIWEKIYEGIVLRMRFTDTLFWVLDAVDEADSPSMLISHLMRIQSFTPIKFFFTSRPMKMPSVFTANNSSVTTCVLTELDTLHDIRTYVHSVVRDALPDDEQIQEDIIDQVLTKASGSFLWVKLALETLQDSWHTQDDIRKALTEVPKGMEQLYEKMLGMIEAQSPRLRLMATRILTWAACCWRPLSIAELHVALEPEFKGFLKLQDTIVQICGHFISVENSKISLVHLTARHFLLHDRDDIPAFVQSKSGHEHIAGVCLRHLSNDKWRRVFKVVEKSKSLGNKNLRINRLVIVEKNHPFLGYATCYWAYHVSKSSVKSQDLLAILQTFFTQYSLLWIEAIALSGNLRYLIRSAQYLKAFTKRMLQKPISDPLESPLSLKEPPEDEAKGIQTWANDFIRIAGKFGPNLVQSPSSIHRLVAPFCPPSSMIGKMYRDMEDKKLSVAGLNSTAWDDCLASVSVEQDEILSKVLATDMYFITLISSGGVIIIWHAETCEEARRINHKEYVPLMALNRSQTCLATAGLHTYRIWDISSGKELYCIPKLAQALTMALEFGKTESEVVVGLDDCTITCYDLETAQISWCFTAQNSETESFGCPRIMALNSDMSKVAMAWRGKPPLVWDITTVESQEPEQCKIHDNYDALCAPEMIQWQTDGNSILILCQNTTLVEWHLYDEDQVEFHHTKAREMTISRDGNFLLTSDNMGTISVWTFPRLCLIYKLINENELIRDLAFSPDGQRFYDIRESRCNIWEPDALVRPEEHEMEDQSSIGEVSVTTEPVISHDESSQSRVTSLATHFEDKYYCCGREDGTVVIHEAFQGKKIRKVYSHASTSSVVILAWSRSGRYIISADDSGRVVAKRLEVKEAGKWGVYPVFDFRMTETVVQILFNHDENMVLISTFSTDLVWGLKEKRELCRRQWVSHQGRRWVEHPLNAELLIWIDAAGGVHTYKWTTLKYSDTTMPSPVASVKPTPVLCGMQASTRAGTHERLVQWISLTRDKRYLVYETLPNTTHTSTRSSDGLHLEFLSIMDLVVYHPHALESECMADLAGQVQRLIGTFEDTVVFLDQDYWLSSWKINTGVNEVKRHFFLPKDWLNASTLHMAALNSQGTFFCPKHGDVAIVRNGMTL